MTQNASSQNVFILLLHGILNKCDRTFRTKRVENNNPCDDQTGQLLLKAVQNEKDKKKNTIEVLVKYEYNE